MGRWKRARGCSEMRALVGGWRLAGMRRFRGRVEFFVRFSVNLGVFPRVFSLVLFAVSFFVFVSSVFFPVSWRRLRGQRFVMHFVGEGVGFLRCVLVIVFVIASWSAFVS